MAGGPLGWARFEGKDKLKELKMKRIGKLKENKELEIEALSGSRKKSDDPPLIQPYNINITMIYR